MVAAPTRHRMRRILNIVRDYRAGVEIADIVEKYGVSRAHVGNLRRQFDLPKRRPGLTPEVREQVARAYAEGVPVMDIVERYRTDRKTIWVIVKAAGLPLRQPRRRE